MSNKKQKTKKRAGKSSSNRRIKADILEFLVKRSPGSYNYRQIAKAIGIQEEGNKLSLQRILLEMENEDLLERARRGKYRVHTEEKEVEGIVDITVRGYAYVVCDGLDEDVFVKEQNLHNAYSEDRVVLKIIRKRSRGKMEGEVIKVLERARTQFVGILEQRGERYIVVPDNKALPFEINISSKDLNSAEIGEKVIAKVTKWPEHRGRPYGVVSERIGKPGLNDTEMKAIAIECGFWLNFPDEVNDEAAKISDRIPQEEIQKRRDLRELITFTIDPQDAKDFDDAISYEKLESGEVEVGIHIADVSHYVRPGTALDKEAYKRATSVYMVDRVLPMLPERLSNLICSLRPDEDKLCYSVVARFKGTELKSHWIGKTVIRSKRRFAYEDAQKVFDTGKGDFSEELLEIKTIAEALRLEKEKNGAVQFDLPELKFKVEKDGTPLGVFRKERLDAHMFIEDLMLMANRIIAKDACEMRNARYAKSFVYRVHDDPKPDRIVALKDFVEKFGYQFRSGSSTVLKRSLNKLILDVKGKPEANIVNQLAVRSMAKAIYTTDNIGHFGLSFPFYSHFTSPIRRYPDLIVHRLTSKYLAGQKPMNQEELEKDCQHCSAQERKAIDAERASLKYKQLEMLKDRIGEEFVGLISGIKDYGVYVELVFNKAEGLVRFRDIRWDNFHFDEKEFAAVGLNFNWSIRLGEEVKVKVTAVDLKNRLLDLVLLEPQED